MSITVAAFDRWDVNEAEQKEITQDIGTPNSKNILAFPHPLAKQPEDNEEQSHGFRRSPTRTITVRQTPARLSSPRIPLFRVQHKETAQSRP